MKITIFVDDSPVAEIPAPGPVRSVFHAGCDFDDCTLDAVYCVGHALELAQVSDIEEAPKVRRALEDLLARVTALAGQMDVPVAPSLIGHWVDVLHQAKAAREVLARFPQ